MNATLVLLLSALAAAPRPAELIACRDPEVAYSLTVDDALRTGDTRVVSVLGSGFDWLVQCADGTTLITHERMIASDREWRVTDAGVLPGQERVLDISAVPPTLDLTCAWKFVQVDRTRLEQWAAATRALPPPKAAGRCKNADSGEVDVSMRRGLVPGTAELFVTDLDVRWTAVIDRKARTAEGALQLSGEGARCYSAAGRHCAGTRSVTLAPLKLDFGVEEEVGECRMDVAAAERILAAAGVR
ncbi:MAG: hypothetical protein QM765_26715 [Myxococcales bacterium]